MGVDQPLVFVHKYRFLVQPYNESFHTPVTLGESVGAAMLIGSPWEYDVPKCSEDIVGCSFVNGTWVYTITGNMMGTSHAFVTLNHHCHAPTCLATELYACAEGT